MRRPGWLITLLACVMACVFIVGWRNLTAHAASARTVQPLAQATQPPDIQNAIDALFIQTAQAQDSIGMTQTVQAAFDQALTGTAQFQATVAAGFEGAMQATRQANAEAAGLSILSPGNMRQIQLLSQLDLSNERPFDLEFSADGSLLFSAGNGISVYDIARQRSERYLNADGDKPFTTIDIDVSNRHNLLAGVIYEEAGQDRTRVSVWEIGSNSLRYTFEDYFGVVGVEFVETDQPTLALFEFSLGKLYLVNPLDGTVLREDDLLARFYETVQGQRGDLSVFAFSPDGQRIALATLDQIVIYDTLTGDQVASWSMFSRDLSALAFSHDHQTLAIGDAGGTIRLNHLETGENQRMYFTVFRSILRLRFNEDDSMVAAVTGNQLGDGQADVVTLWDTRTLSNNYYDLGVNYEGPAVAFSPVGTYFALTARTNFAAGGVELWAVRSASAPLPTPGSMDQATQTFLEDSRATAQAVGTALQATVISMTHRGTATAVAQVSTPMPQHPTPIIPAHTLDRSCAEYALVSGLRVKLNVLVSEIELRDQPMLAGAALDILTLNQQVQLLGVSSSGGYLYVCTEDGQVGWVSRQMLSLPNPPTIAIPLVIPAEPEPNLCAQATLARRTQAGAVSSIVAVVRAQPSPDAGIILELDRDARLDVFGQTPDGDFVYACTEADIPGWIARQAVSLESSAVLETVIPVDE